MPMTDISVYIVDDDDAVRDSLLELLESVDVKGIAFASGAEFMEAATSETRGVLILDIRMPGMSGLELQKALNGSGINIPIIFITGHGDVPMAVEAMKGGAVEFLQKPFRDQELLDCIQSVLSRLETELSEATSNRQTEELLCTLTPREKQVLDFIVDGKPNKLIAHELSISQRTVENHRANLLHKMGARNTADLVRMVSTGP